MSGKGMAVLAIGALALAGIAYVVTTSGGSRSTGSTGATGGGAGGGVDGAAFAPGAKLFDASRAGEVARLTIEGRGKRVEIVRATGEPAAPSGSPRSARSTWTVASKAGYPAQDDRVRELARRVLDLAVVAPKTADPAMYERLDVQDLPPEASAGEPSPSHAPTGPILVTLADGSGKAIASVILGKRQDAANFDPAKATTFVRPAGQARSYLIAGSVTASSDPLEWVARSVLDFAPDRFREVIVTHPGASDGADAAQGATSVTIRRKDAASAEYELVGMPPGRELADPSAHQRVLHAMANLTFDDVTNASEIVPRQAQEGMGQDGKGQAGEPQSDAWQDAVVATFTTFDGVTLTVRSISREGGANATPGATGSNVYWLTVGAAYDPALAIPTPPTEPDDAEKARQAQIRAEIDALQARLAGWAFQAPEWKARQVRTTLGELLKPGAMTAPTTPEGVTPATPEVPEGLRAPDPG
jgi:hypothetical protein